MVTGRVEQGIVKTGDNVEVVGLRPSMQTTVTGEGCFFQDDSPACLGEAEVCFPGCPSHEPGARGTRLVLALHCGLDITAVTLEAFRAVPV